MSTSTVIVIVVVVVVVLAIAVTAGLVMARRRRISLKESEEQQDVSPGGSRYQAGAGFDLAPGGSPTATTTEEPPAEHPAGERTELDGQPGVGEDAAVPRDAGRPGITEVSLPEEAAPPETARPESVEPPETVEPPRAAEPAPPVPEQPPAEDVPTPQESTVEPPERAAEPVPEEPIEPVQGRLERLRGRLSRSRSTLGQGVLGLLGAGDLDEDSWEELEDTLLLADLGSATALEIVQTLREQLSAQGVRTSEQARAVLRSVLVQALRPELDRALHALPHAGGPAVLLVVGVNGTGKTTTTGKLARVLVGGGRKVMLGAADTFRAAAVDQLQTWGERVGAETVRGKEGADPAAVAFDSAKRGIEAGVDAVLVDTAGRLHTKTGLMDELGKVKRVVEKQAKVDEVLLVLDATTGQNGLTQARVFAEVVDVTGVVLTKLDGTAKGGIVFQVQRELGVPVKLVGLGEGADDLAPFEPEAFVDALLG